MRNARRVPLIVVVVGLTLVVAAGVYARSAFGGNGGVTFMAHPDDQHARAYLAQLATWAKEGDSASLCDHGTGNCPDFAKDAMAYAPKTPPLVVGSREIPDNGFAQGGRELQVCGLDGAGAPYHQRILFFGDDSNWSVIEATFWAIGFSEGNSAPASPANDAGLWPSCPG